jgi:hypothetical protein
MIVDPRPSSLLALPHEMSYCCCETEFVEDRGSQAVD